MINNNNQRFFKDPPREKCPNKEFFRVRIFPRSDWIRRDTLYLSVFSLNVGKYGPEKTPSLDTSHSDLPKEQCSFLHYVVLYSVFQTLVVKNVGSYIFVGILPDNLILYLWYFWFFIFSLIVYLFIQIMLEWSQ